MEIKVDLNPEQINKTITEAIAKSAIGKELERVINDQVDRLSRSYDNPIEKVVQQEINLIVQKIIREDYKEQIIKIIKEKVSEKFTDDLLEKLWNAFSNHY